MGNLYLLMGIPGSGKSTWTRNHLTPYDWYVSRDDIRFALVPDGEPYFSKEKEVLKRYIEDINIGLNLGYDVYADATQVSKWSRNNILNKVKNANKVNCIYIKTSLKVALERNEGRDGRLRVPSDQIQKMYRNIEEPTFEEGFEAIYIIEEGKPIQIKRKG